MALPGRGVWQLAEQWAAGVELNRARALEATYDWCRGAIARSLVVAAACGASLSVSVSAIAGATGLRLVQYAILGGVVGVSSHLIGFHTVAEAPMRPVRIALTGDMGIGDSLPSSRPTFAAWSNVAMLAATLGFARRGRDVVGGVPFCESAALGVGDDRLRVGAGLRCAEEQHQPELEQDCLHVVNACRSRSS
ncbi:MAG: hypothetical protein WB989_00960, partial [Mycobacterium sp.]